MYKKLDIKKIISYISSIVNQGGREMSYREKFAWLSLIAMVVTYVPYFAIVAAGYFPARPLPDLHLLSLFAAVSIVRVLILGIGYLCLRLASPEEASTPLDERDRAIKSRSTSFAYYVLIAGMIKVGCFMPFLSSGWTIVNAALFMIVTAEVVREGVVVFCYRRQS
jgi:hypothetical protein